MASPWGPMVNLEVDLGLRGHMVRHQGCKDHEDNLIQRYVKDLIGSTSQSLDLTCPLAFKVHLS